MSNFLVAALYHFVPLDDVETLQKRLLEETETYNIIGTLLLASEGINGTIAGHAKDVAAFLNILRSDEQLAPYFQDLVHKESYAEEKPFHRMRVKLKREIVTMGVPGTDPKAIVGTYVKPQEWNALLRDPQVIVVDTRNDYEVEIGTFSGAEDPDIKTFRAFPDWVDARVAQARADGVEKPKVAMFCTGGIRCEKSTSYLKSKGIDDVFHLEGGILKYLEEVTAELSLWQGECFVFDERVSVGNGLKLGPYSLCRACRRPITDDDKDHTDYEEGVSCRRCIAQTSEKQKKRFRERQHQIRLAKKRAQHRES